MGRTIFSNRWQATKLRALLWLFLAIALGCVLWSADILQTFGNRPADGAALFPFHERVIIAGIVFSLGVGSFIGFVLFGRHYPVEMRRVGDTLEIDVLTLTGRSTKPIALSALRSAKDHHGQFLSLRGQFVSAPWLSLYVTGRRFPFIVDLQAEEIDLSEIEAVTDPQLARR